MRTFLHALFIVGIIGIISSTAIAQEKIKPARSIIVPKSYPVTITNLGEPINSSDDDFAPMVLGNGRLMYLSTNRDGSQSIFSVTAEKTGWGQAQEVGTSLNTSGDEGSTSITPDGHWMVFSGCEREGGQGDCDIYIAEYIGGAWRNIRNLGPQVNSPQWESQPSISADGQTLYFVSDRPGSWGGTDIYFSTRRNGGEWSAASNLGNTINTSGDELAPCIAADNSTLYFSSDEHPGIGGLDVYVSRKKQSTWSVPENMGTPLNSDEDDYFYALQIGSDNIYFASSRPGGTGDLDIYLGVPNPIPPSPVTAVMGSVLDSKEKTPLGALLTVRDIQNNEVISSFHSDDINGNYVVVLQPGKRYVITAEAPGYLFYSDRFDVPKESENNIVRKDITMTRDIVRLLVYFDFNATTLQDESAVDLDRAAQWLKDNPNVKVELAGHTDNVGAKDYNKRLSHDRATAVVDYLVKKGIATTRLKAEGYGMEQPVTTNDTEEGRAQNRRVEFRVKTQ